MAVNKVYADATEALAGLLQDVAHDVSELLPALRAVRHVLFDHLRDVLRRPAAHQLPRQRRLDERRPLLNIRFLKIARRHLERRHDEFLPAPFAGQHGLDQKCAQWLVLSWIVTIAE